MAGTFGFPQSVISVFVYPRLLEFPEEMRELHKIFFSSNDEFITRFLIILFAIGASCVPVLRHVQHSHC